MAHEQARHQLVHWALRLGLKWDPTDLLTMPFLCAKEEHYSEACAMGNTSFCNAYEKAVGRAALCSRGKRRPDNGCTSAQGSGTAAMKSSLHPFRAMEAISMRCNTTPIRQTDSERTTSRVWGHAAADLPLETW